MTWPSLVAPPIPSDLRCNPVARRIVQSERAPLGSTRRDPCPRPWLSMSVSTSDGRGLALECGGSIFRSNPFHLNRSVPCHVEGEQVLCAVHGLVVGRLGESKRLKHWPSREGCICSSGNSQQKKPPSRPIRQPMHAQCRCAQPIDCVDTKVLFCSVLFETWGHGTTRWEWNAK